MKLSAAEAPGQKKGWIRVPALGAMKKADLQDLTVTLAEDRLQELQARVAEYLGLLPDPE